MTNKKGIVSILNEFFGRKPGQTLAEFNAELKTLTEAEKLEMAKAAAKSLGYTQDQLAFSL